MHQGNQTKFRKVKTSVFLNYTVFAISVSFLVIYLWVVLSRITYPFELEWIEGGILDQVRRVVNEQGIYLAPSIDFVPFLYPPGYFYISAGASLLFGDGFFSLRLVSFVASLISFTVIFLIVHAETKNLWLASLSTGLFVASFRVTGAWLDIARVDSLFLALLLLAIYFVRGNNNLRNVVLAAVFAALAFLTKQTALIICVSIILFLLWRNWKYALVFLVVAGSLAGITTLVLNQITEGWYTYYVFDLLSQQTQWMPLEFLGFWKDDLMVHLPIALFLTVLFFGTKARSDHPLFLKWLFIFFGALVGTFISRVKIGGYDNVLLPLFAVLAILFGLGLDEILKFVTHLPAPLEDGAEKMIYIACLIQFIVLFYNPYAQIPTKADLTQGENFVEYLAEIEGTVYLPDHGYLLTLAGKNTYAHHAAIWDVLRTDQVTEGKIILMKDLENAIQQQVFDIIILDEGGNFCCRDIDQYYTKVGEVFHDEISFFPVTGDRRRPAFIYTVSPSR